MHKKLTYIAFIMLLANCTQSQNKAPQAEVNNPTIKKTEISRTDLVKFAKTYIGTKYHHAGVDPATGFDCSGFVYFVFNNFGIKLPRGSGEYKSLGKSLKPEEFKVGDVLVFYGYKDKTQIGHVGIICEADGMKSRFIHSTSGKAYGITISELDSEMYTSRFYKCIDVIH
ncbi:MAG: C40 family peptidase [Lentimicrobium sp.]|nr:C40 family peptidase [Lentimicrobium sp.]